MAKLSAIFVLGLTAIIVHGVPLEKRISQTISDSTQQWVQACNKAGGGGQCSDISVTAFSTLLAAAGPCDQQNSADAMIDLAKQLSNDPDMIKFAQIFAQQPRNTPTGESVQYCQQAPKNAELDGLFQCQFQGAKQDTFVGGVQVGSAGTIPFGLNSPLSPPGSCPANPDGPIPDGQQLVSITQDPGLANIKSGSGSSAPPTGLSSIASSASATASGLSSVEPSTVAPTTVVQTSSGSTSFPSISSAAPSSTSVATSVTVTTAAVSAPVSSATSSCAATKKKRAQKKRLDSPMRMAKRIAQDTTAAAKPWEDACTKAGGGEQCNTIAVTAFGTLLAAADPCAQQDSADAMIDLAKTLNSDADMIKLAQIFAQQPRNTPTSQAVPYCHKAPKNAELDGLFQCQFQSADEQTFVGGLAVGSPGTIPFGQTAPVSPPGSCPASPAGPVPDGQQLLDFIQETGASATASAPAASSSVAVGDNDEDCD